MGNMISQGFPPKPIFAVEQIPDLSGQVIIVTGGNAGVGKETIKALLNKNAKVYLAARSKSKADAAIEWLKQETGGKSAIFLELDLGNLASVRKAAAEFKSKEQELHVLFNNAGVMTPPVDQKTSDGYDLQFGTNVLGHYLFTTLLVPTLIHTAKNSPLAGGHARVVNTSSYAAYLAQNGSIMYDTLRLDDNGAKACAKLGTQGLYAQSKLGNVLFSDALAKKYADQGIISVSVNPGNLKTELQRHLATPVTWLLNLILYHASYGALTQLWAGTMPEGVQLNGKYLIPWARVGSVTPPGRDDAAVEQLWTWLEEQAKSH